MAKNKAKVVRENQQEANNAAYFFFNHYNNERDVKWHPFRIFISKLWALIAIKAPTKVFLFLLLSS